MTLSIKRTYANSTPLVLLIRVYFGNNSCPYPGVLPSKPMSPITVACCPGMPSSRRGLQRLPAG